MARLQAIFAQAAGPRTGRASSMSGRSPPGLGQWLARTGKLSEDRAVQLAGEIRGVASTVKLLSALFSSSEGYSLGSVDVGDAYLMVA